SRDRQSAEADAGARPEHQQHQPLLDAGWQTSSRHHGRFLMFADRQPRSFLDAGALSRLAAVPLCARRPMQGNVSGRHTRPHRGASVEFAEYRKYVPGDDLRRLDWRAYGRSDRFYVKEFEADTNLRCCFVLDTSGSMGFGSKGVTKLEYARRIA